MSDVDFIAQTLAWVVIIVLLVGYQLHTYLAEPIDLDQDLDSFD